MRNLYQLLLELEWIVEDIDNWSILNDDKFNERISIIRENVSEFRKEVKDGLKSTTESEEA